jgi:hypothetical protein
MLHVDESRDSPSLFEICIESSRFELIVLDMNRTHTCPILNDSISKAPELEAAYQQIKPVSSLQGCRHNTPNMQSKLTTI